MYYVSKYVKKYINFYKKKATSVWRDFALARFFLDSQGVPLIRS